MSEMPEPMRWRDLAPNRPGYDPDEFVEVGGHPLFPYDEVKARSLIERCRALGGSEFVASPDLVYMHAPVDSTRVTTYGFVLTVDPALPVNTVNRKDE